MSAPSLNLHSSSISPSSVSSIEEKNEKSKMSTITKVAIGALVVFIATVVTVPTCLAVFTVATPALIGIIVPSLFITFVSGGICGSWVYQSVKNWLEEDDVSNIFSSPGVGDADADDMEVVSPELKAEIAKVAHGITNPGCNCFMNAMLQNIFSFDDLSKYFLEKLDQIANDESLAKTNPCAFDPALVKVNKPKEMSDADYIKYKATQIALIKPWDLVNITSKPIGDVIKDYFSSEREIEQFYMGLSVKDAASYVLEIINKWRSKKDLSYQEAQLLRVALIKVMNRQVIIRIQEPATKDSEAKVDITIPGIDGPMSISSNRQECPSDFFNDLITSLKELTKSLSPTTIKSEEKFEIFAPSPSDGVARFSEELKKSMKITKEEDDFLSMFIEKSYSQVDLSHKLIFKNKYETVILKNKEGNDIKKSYDFSLPEILIVQANTNDYKNNAKFHNTEYKFSDEENLRIHFPVSEMNKSEKTYELRSFIVHKGDSPSCGHYINYTKITREDGSSYWICQNDSSCSFASVDKVKSLLKGSGNKSYTPAILSFEKI